MLKKLLKEYEELPNHDKVLLARINRLNKIHELFVITTLVKNDESEQTHRLVAAMNPEAFVKSFEPEDLNNQLRYLIRAQELLEARWVKS